MGRCGFLNNEGQGILTDLPETYMKGGRGQILFLDVYFVFVCTNHHRHGNIVSYFQSTQAQVVFRDMI